MLTDCWGQSNVVMALFKCEAGSNLLSSTWLGALKDLTDPTAKQNAEQ